MGCAAFGHSGCTCPSPDDSKRTLEITVRGLERRVLELEKLVYRQNRRDAGVTENEGDVSVTPLGDGKTKIGSIPSKILIVRKL